jgi:hypothetical protein
MGAIGLISIGLIGTMSIALRQIGTWTHCPLVQSHFHAHCALAGVAIKAATTAMIYFISVSPILLIAGLSGSKRTSGGALQRRKDNAHPLALGITMRRGVQVLAALKDIRNVLQFTGGPDHPVSFGQALEWV